MKLQKRHFILIECILLVVGILLMSFIFMDYANNSETLENLNQREASLKKDQEFDLPSSAKKVYEKIFMSPYDTNNIVPRLQKKILDVALLRDVSIVDVKIKKTENGVFSFAVKMTSKDDRSIYAFIGGIENLNEVFVFSKNVILQKRLKIGGEYHFEAYTKS